MLWKPSARIGRSCETAALMPTRRLLGDLSTSSAARCCFMPIRLLRHDRAHDYRFLMRRWRAVAEAANLRIKKTSEAGGCSFYCIASRPKTPDAQSFYLPAGIHGDEAGATEGLVEW